MLESMKESDWTVFKRVHGLALDRYCQRALAEIEHVLSHKDENAYERYVSISELMKKSDKEMREIFSDFRCSTAKIHLMRMVSEKLVTADELAKFSSEVVGMIEHIAAMRQE